MESDSLRKILLYLSEFLDYFCREIHRIHTWNLRYTDYHSWSPVDESISSSLTVESNIDGRYISENSSIRKWSRSDFLYSIADWFQIDRELRSRRESDPCSSRIGDLWERWFETCHRDMSRGELRRIDRDRILWRWASHDEEIRDARNGRERLTKRRLCIDSEIWLRHLGSTTGETNPHDLTHQSGFWSDCHISSGREFKRSNFLIDFLTIDIDTTSPVEFDIDHRESLSRARSDRIHARYGSHSSFEWESDELLDIFWSESLNPDKYSDTGTIEIWEDIYREFGETIETTYCHDDIDHDDKEAFIESPLYECIEHIYYGWEDMSFVTSIPSFQFDFQASVTIISPDLSHSVATVFSQMISRLIFHFLRVVPLITL